MFRSLRSIVAVLALVAGSLAFTATAASASPVDSLAQHTLVYSATGAGEFQSTANQAAGIWNSKVPNIHLQTAGSPTIRIYVTNSGGSRAYVQGLGRGTVYIDRTQVNQGHSPLRILAHELGHILGLPDNYNGNCAILMSGGSAGTSCKNPNPSTAEAARVNQLVGFAAAPSVREAVYVY